MLAVRTRQYRKPGIDNAAPSGCLRWPALVDACLFGRLDTLYLTLVPDVGLKLSEDTQHAEKCLAGGRRRVNDRLERDALRLQLANDIGEVAFEPRKKHGGAEFFDPARERVMSDLEIRWLWQATGDLGEPFGPALRLLSLLRQRRGEVGGMRWDELAGDTGLCPPSAPRMVGLWHYRDRLRN